MGSNFLQKRYHLEALSSVLSSEVLSSVQIFCFASIAVVVILVLAQPAVPHSYMREIVELAFCDGGSKEGGRKERKCFETDKLLPKGGLSNGMWPL